MTRDGTKETLTTAETEYQRGGKGKWWKRATETGSHRGNPSGGSRQPGVKF